MRRVLNAELNFMSAEESNNFRKAEQCEPWHKAMQSIQDNDTWELSMLPADHRAISLKWIYKVKHDEASNIIWLKGLSGGQGVCPARWCGLRQGLRSCGTFGIGAHVGGAGSSLTLGSAPDGCQECVPQRNHQGRGICSPASWVRHRRERRNGAMLV
jgi:hypothetical protein